jgi:hypothetical protein
VSHGPLRLRRNNRGRQIRFSATTWLFSEVKLLPNREERVRFFALRKTLLTQESLGAAKLRLIPSGPSYVVRFPPFFGVLTSECSRMARQGQRKNADAQVWLRVHKATTRAKSKAAGRSDRARRAMVHTRATPTWSGAGSLYEILMKYLFRGSGALLVDFAASDLGCAVGPQRVPLMRSRQESDGRRNHASNSLLPSPQGSQSWICTLGQTRVALSK